MQADSKNYEVVLHSCFNSTKSRTDWALWAVYAIFSSSVFFWSRESLNVYKVDLNSGQNSEHLEPKEAFAYNKDSLEAFFFLNLRFICVWSLTSLLQTLPLDWAAKKNTKLKFKFSGTFSPAECRYESHFCYHVQIFRKFMTNVWKSTK